MIVTALLLTLLIDEPRFTRTDSPEAMVRAEVYAREGRDPLEQAQALLGRAPYDTRQIESPEGPLMVLAAEEPGAPNQRLVAYALPGGRDNWMCLISTQQPQGPDNRQEAMTWCLSFLITPRVRFDLPAMSPPALPEG